MGNQVPPEHVLFEDKLQINAMRLERKLITLRDCPADVRARAEALCNRSADDEVSVVQQSCIFDVCFGGEEYAVADAVMDQQVVDAPAPMMIRWATHGGLCLGVGGGQLLNGSALQVWECIPGHGDMQFLAPSGGVGQIRWASHPSMCLDVAQGWSELGTRLQLWECEAGQRDMRFLVPPGGKGKVRWAADATMCLDVRAGKTTLGTQVQLWKCMGEGQANQEFEFSSGSP